MRYVYFGNELPKKIIQKDWIYDDKQPDIVFSFGGDGTMLGAIHKYNNEETIFIGIKSGKLGFFYSFNTEDFSNIIKILEEKNYQVNRYNLIEYNLIGDNIKNGFAVNEIAITNPIHTQIIDVYINNVLFECFRGTGFICSAPAGSTAYSRSMGGSIISPDLEAFQLVEIASINNRLYKTISSPLIFSKNYELVLKPINNQNLYVSVDGVEEKVSNIKEIKIKLSSKTVKILNINEDFFIKVKKAFLN